MFFLFVVGTGARSVVAVSPALDGGSSRPILFEERVSDQFVLVQVIGLPNQVVDPVPFVDLVYQFVFAGKHDAVATIVPVSLVFAYLAVRHLDLAAEYHALVQIHFQVTHSPPGVYPGFVVVPDADCSQGHVIVELYSKGVDGHFCVPYMRLSDPLFEQT